MLYFVNSSVVRGRSGVCAAAWIALNLYVAAKCRSLRIAKNDPAISPMMKIWRHQRAATFLVACLQIVLYPLYICVVAVLWLFGYFFDYPDDGTEIVTPTTPQVPSAESDAKVSDSTGTLTFFAGLLTTQAAGLVVLLQGKAGLTFISALIYLAFELMPLAGIVITVLRKRLGTQLAYTPQAVSFARWVLLYGILLAIVLPILGATGNIPGQSSRIDYADPFIPSFPLAQRQTSLTLSHKNRFLDEWATAQLRGLAQVPEAHKQVVVVEQDGAFAADYKDIVTSFSFGEMVISGATHAYLISNAGSEENLPRYRRLRVLPADSGGHIAQHSVVINEPSRGDFLIMFLIVEARDGSELQLPADPSQLRFEWRAK